MASRRVQRKLQSKFVKQLQATKFEAAALLGDGSVVTWDLSSGRPRQRNLASVQQLFSTEAEFAVLLDDGSVLSWNTDPEDVDNYDSHDDVHPVSWTTQTKDDDYDYVHYPGEALFINSVSHIYANRFYFAAFTPEATLIWGLGTKCKYFPGVNDVKQVQATQAAFAALLKDGSVVCFGDEEFDGDASLARLPLNDVQQIHGADDVFTAVQRDGMVRTWGLPQTPQMMLVPGVDTGLWVNP